MSVSEAFRDPRGYVVRTAGMYRALLFDPERFYDDHLPAHGIKLEIVLVAVIGLVGLAGNWYAYTQVTQAFTEAGISIGDDARFNLVGNGLSPLPGIFLLWLGFGAVMYVVGWVYSTVGQIFGVLKGAAWALVPLAFWNLIHSIAIGYVAFQLTEDDVADLRPPRAPDARSEFIWNEVATEPIVVGSVLVGVVFVLWAGYIGAFAVARERDIDPSEGLVVAAVPAVGYALYVLYVGVTRLL